MLKEYSLFIGQYSSLGYALIPFIFLTIVYLRTRKEDSLIFLYLQFPWLGIKIFCLYYFLPSFGLEHGALICFLGLRILSVLVSIAKDPNKKFLTEFFLYNHIVSSIEVIHLYIKNKKKNNM